MCEDFNMEVIIDDKPKSGEEKLSMTEYKARIQDVEDLMDPGFLPPSAPFGASGCACDCDEDLKDKLSYQVNKNMVNGKRRKAKKTTRDIGF